MERGELMKSPPTAEELLELMPINRWKLISLRSYPKRPPLNGPNQEHIDSAKWTKWAIKIAHGIRGFSSDGW